MPKLSCWSCGRQIYTVAPLEALFAEERRCPRCGAFLRQDRREAERRLIHRRVNPPHDPGPPKPVAKAASGAKRTTTSMGKTTKKIKEPDEAADDPDRRVAERRTGRRRGASRVSPSGASEDSGGWRD